MAGRRVTKNDRFPPPGWSVAAAARGLYSVWPLREGGVTYSMLHPQRKASFRRWARFVLLAAAGRGEWWKR